MQDLPDSKLKNQIDKTIKIRALIEVGKASISIENYKLLNSNDKIVLRLSIEKIMGVGKFLKFQSLRGYHTQLNIVEQLLKEQVDVTTNENIFNQIIKLKNKSAADYDPRINVNLKPEMKTADATKLILGNLFETMTKNVEGIIKDIDTEFLHDFRVASRRTRAVLSQLKNVFDEKLTEQFIADFRLLGKKTNKIRDLDVYLLNRNNYIKRLPKNMWDDIDPFFEELMIERKVELREFIRYLKSDTYKNQIQRYNQFLSSPVKKSVLAFNAEKPVKLLAIEFINKQYNKVIEMGGKISSHSKDSKYHKLRIQCKKLRYLLEFFSSLFPEEKISILVSQLKTLQDNLGLFNDLSVQQETLKIYSQKPAFNTKLVLALGILIGKLHEEQLQVKKKFRNIFTQFSEDQNIKLLKDILKHTGEI